MGSERPTIMYGRYYYGQEAIIENANDENNIQYHRTETSGHLTDPLPPDSFGSRRLQTFNHSAVRGGIASQSNDYHCVQGPSYEYTRNYHGYERQPFQSLDFRGHGIGNNNDLDYGYGASSQWNSRNYHSYVRQPSDSFQFRRRGDIDPAINNDYHCVQGPSYEYNRNRHGYGRQPPDSSAFRRQGDISAGHNNDYHVPVPESNLRNHDGNGSLLSCPEPPDYRHQGFSSEIHENVLNADSILNHERSKLMQRIKTIFRKFAPVTFSENSAAFDKQDWIKVSHIFPAGLKIYQAEMTCPVCFGKSSPYNRAEPGRLPKWDLFAVKRHVELKHPESDVQLSVGIELSEEEHVGNEYSKEKESEEKESEEKESEEKESEEKESEEKESEEKESEEKESEKKESEKKVSEKKVSEKKVSKDKASEKKASKEKASEKIESKRKGSDKKPSEKKPSEEKSSKKKQSEEEIELLDDSTSDFPSLSSDSVQDNGSVSSSSSEPGADQFSKKVGRMTHKKGTKKRGKIEQKSSFTKRRKTKKQLSSSEESDSPENEKHGKPSNRKRRKIKKPASSSEESYSPDIPDWKKPGVDFGWVKLTALSRFQPAFIFPKKPNDKKRRAQYLHANGQLSDLTHPVEVVATSSEVEQAKKLKKSQAYLKAIKKFNDENDNYIK